MFESPKEKIIYSKLLDYTDRASQALPLGVQSLN